MARVYLNHTIDQSTHDRQEPGIQELCRKLQTSKGITVILCKYLGLLVLRRRMNIQTAFRADATDTKSYDMA